MRANKIAELRFFILFLLALISIVCCDSSAAERKISVFVAGAIEDEAQALAEVGDFEGALRKYAQVLDPKYWEHEWETSTARGAIVAILTFQGKYEEALREFEWHLKMNPEKYQDRKEELLALDAYKQTGEAEAVYAVIEKLKNKYPNFLPPNGLSATDLASRIIRLYETIGDLDRGEAYARACVFYFYKNAAEHGTVMEPGLTAQQAHDKGQERNRIADAYVILADLLTVYEGFQKDREQGFSGCAKTAPGEVCMGNATKAIIQSKFYPW